MTVISARIFLPLGLALLLPLALAGCGSAGNGSALKNSAHLTPPPMQENKQTAALAADASSDDGTKTPKLATKNEGAEAKQTVAAKSSGASKPILTAKVDMPPMPVRRPYRKLRKKSAARMIKDQKPSAKIADKMITTSVAKPKVQTTAQPTIKPSVVIVAKVPKVEMVPKKAVPVQIAPDKTSELIFSGFIDGSGVNASHQVSTEEIKAAKMAQAESVANKPSFGQSEYRFSGQK